MYKPEYNRRHYNNNKEYYRQKRLKRTREIKTLLNNIKASGCKLCPEKEPVALDFHHFKNRDKKEFNPSEIAVRGWSKDRILKYLEDCMVLCANCHRKVTAGLISMPS